MKRRAARAFLVLVAAGLAGAAVHQAVVRSQALDAAAYRERSLAAEAARAEVALAELAAAQRGYVAPGQGLDFWTTRADEALAAARGALAGIGAEPAGGVPARVPAALDRLDDFAVVDGRARALARAGQRAAASDLIFADGYEILAAARAEMASAFSVAQAAAAAPGALDRQIRLASIGVLGAITAIALLLLLRAPRAPEPMVTTLGAAGFAYEPETRAQPAERAAPDDEIGAALDASLEGLEQVPQVPRVPQVPPEVDLAAAADLCVDLGRLLDARDLQGLLARAVSVLDAYGLIVWLADERRQALAPALTHGYEPSLVERVGHLPAAADNATASAWRTGSLQVVPGALAVPLLTRAGCSGVLAIEVRGGRERSPALQALARIVAAQLATTISPETADTRKAAGG